MAEIGIIVGFVAIRVAESSTLSSFDRSTTKFNESEEVSAVAIDTHSFHDCCHVSLTARSRA